MKDTLEAPAKKSEFKPILIHENHTLFDQILALGGKACGAIPAVKEAYEALRIGPWDNQAYQRVLNELFYMERDHLKKMQAEYEALPFRSETVKREITESVWDQFAALQGAVDKLKSAAESKSQLYSIPSFPVDRIVIENGKPVIPESAEEEIREAHCRTYITNAADLEVYDAFKTLEEATNRILKAVRERNPRAASDLEFAYRNDTLLGLQEDKSVKLRMNAFKWLALKK